MEIEKNLTFDSREKVLDLEESNNQVSRGARFFQFQLSFSRQSPERKEKRESKKGAIKRRRFGCLIS